MLKSMLPLVLLGALSLPGCAEMVLNDPEPVRADLVGSSHMAAQALIQTCRDPLQKGGRLIAASFVNVNDLTRSSGFGRIIAEQVAGQFSAAGYNVVEMLLRNDVYIRETEGSFLLSRDIQKISERHNAQAVIVGMYAVGRENVFVTAKLVRATDNVVLATYDYQVPIDSDVGRLLRD